MRTEAERHRDRGPSRAGRRSSTPTCCGVWRRYAKLRTQLYPYLAAADATYQRSGLPIMRHLALAYPRDARATARDDEFLFGPDLLVAPVLEPGATQRDALPAARALGRPVALGRLRAARRLAVG